MHIRAHHACIDVCGFVPSGGPMFVRDCGQLDIRDWAVREWAIYESNPDPLHERIDGI